MQNKLGNILIRILPQKILHFVKLAQHWIVSYNLGGEPLWGQAISDIFVLR